MSAPLKLHRLRLYFTPGADADEPARDLDIIVTPGDRMRAERFSTAVLPPSQRGAQAVRAAHAQTWLMLYAWCAATRMGYAGDFEAFDLELLHYAELGADGELLEDDDEPDDDDAESVPPTVPGPPTS
jgi:hypothetical protein